MKEKNVHTQAYLYIQYLFNCNCNEHPISDEKKINWVLYMIEFYTKTMKTKTSEKEHQLRNILIWLEMN